MKPITTASVSLFFMAIWASAATVSAQSDLKTPPATHCPAATEIQPIHLYGLWQAEFGNSQPTAIVRMSRHPEWTGSVRGEVDRSGVKKLIAGDVDQGELALDESNDGQIISATWSGQVAIHSCGKEIQGIWTDNTNNTSTSFVLRKQPGWQ